MRMKIALAVGYIISTFLASFCPMQMATAMPMPEKMRHVDMTEMAMHSMSPMSFAHCEHCEKIQSRDEDQPQPQSGCAGHCFSQAYSTAARTVLFNVPIVGVSTPTPVTVAFASQTTTVVSHTATAPPIAIYIDTIVLRF